MMRIVVLIKKFAFEFRYSQSIAVEINCINSVSKKEFRGAITMCYNLLYSSFEVYSVHAMYSITNLKGLNVIFFYCFCVIDKW